MPATSAFRPDRSKDVAATLQHLEVHVSWGTGYQTPENEAFCKLALDYVAEIFGPPDDDAVLDAGCGWGAKSIPLACRGYPVLGVDFSEKVLELGRRDVAAAGLADRIRLRCEDLTAMSFPDESFGRILCWGVLMHVPEVDRAIAELSRVARRDALIVVSEGNMRSVQAVGLRAVKRLLHRQRGELRATAAGMEFWEETPTGTLLTRQARIDWIVSCFAEHGVTLLRRRAGEFSELFTMLPWKPARSLVHAWNSLWFRWPALPGPSFGNLLVFRKGSTAPA
jgi:2-polyprenyl-3-methyl-5-hydroxy-6-metoxy-1,4-benzoquinol methylase